MNLRRWGAVTRLLVDNRESLEGDDRGTDSCDSVKGASIRTSSRKATISESYGSSAFEVDLDQLHLPTVTPCSHLKLTDFTECIPHAEGTNSVLYRANTGSMSVIIKMVKKSMENDATALREFELEKSILEHIDHPNIVRLLGSGMEPRPFMVMEYLNGGTLEDLLIDLQRSRRDPLKQSCVVRFNLKEVLQWARELADALNYLHTKVAPGVCIIHRDLKPENMGLSNGSVRLFDFGLSICVRRRTIYNEAYEMTGCTGTLRYMAPEVALRRPYSEKVDVYSFGIILWQMATGVVPFRKATKESFMECVVKCGARPPLDPAWPNELGDLMEQCWHEQSESRPPFRLILKRLDELI